MKLISKFLGAIAAASLLSLPAHAESKEAATIEQSLKVLRELQAISDTRIPDLLLSKAEGIVILPANVKVGLVFGARFGNGVMLVRNPDRSWSNPVFVSTGGGSWGFQAGGQVSDIVLVFTTRQSVEGITDGKMTLGADASVAAGPVGRTAMAGTSVTFDAEIYAYSKTQGLFAGVSLEGNGIFIRGPQLNVAISNGTISGWKGIGVNAEDAHNMLLSDLRVGGNGLCGVRAGHGAIITNVVAQANGGSGIAGPGAFSRRVGPGDIIIIPNKVAHGWSGVTDHVEYLSFRPDPDRVLPAGWVYPLLLRAPKSEVPTPGVGRGNAPAAAPAPQGR